MSNALRLITSIMNYFHENLVLLSRHLGLHFDDKQLHFFVIGLLGIVFFIFVNAFFKYLARYSVTAISFIYTFTVLVVLVFAIEIGQKVTGHGNMEFQDIVEGLWGFLIAFALYLVLIFIVRGLKKLFKMR